MGKLLNFVLILGSVLFVCCVGLSLASMYLVSPQESLRNAVLDTDNEINVALKVLEDDLGDERYGAYKRDTDAIRKIIERRRAAIESLYLTDELEEGRHAYLDYLDSSDMAYKTLGTMSSSDVYEVMAGSVFSDKLLEQVAIDKLKAYGIIFGDS